MIMMMMMMMMMMMAHHDDISDSLFSKLTRKYHSARGCVVIILGVKSVSA